MVCFEVLFEYVEVAAPGNYENRPGIREKKQGMDGLECNIDVFFRSRTIKKRICDWTRYRTCDKCWKFDPDNRAIKPFTKPCLETVTTLLRNEKFAKLVRRFYRLRQI